MYSQIALASIEDSEHLRFRFSPVLIVNYSLSVVSELMNAFFLELTFIASTVQREAASVLVPWLCE
jgi:hypothetical protein